jgi:flagellar hook-associated protein 1 FlgK
LDEEVASCQLLVSGKWWQLAAGNWQLVIMSLIGALNIGNTALAVTQAQIQTTGNNIANAGDPNYTRQVAGSTPSADQQLRPGLFVGTGVDLTGIQRQIDQALESRLRASSSDTQAASTTQDWLGRIQAAFNELGDSDLSTQFSTFFNAWSDLANKPQDIGLRQVVLQDGVSLSHSMQDLRGQLAGLQSDVGAQLQGLTKQADDLARQIADLNGRIVTAESGSPNTANALRDQRDAALKQLSQLMNTRVVEQPSGAVDVYVGTEPLINGTESRGVTLIQSAAAASSNGLIDVQPTFKSTSGTITVTGGQIGALIGVQQQIDDTVNHTDDLAKGLIYELNKVHASGQGLQGFTSVSSANAVTDAAVPLNDPKSGLKFPAQNGSFVVHVKQKGSDLVTSTLVQVDLDGQGGNDTTLNSLAASLSAINGVSATVSGGRLTIAAANPSVEISFSQDSSGTLASLGINNFFTGKDARDIAVSQTLLDDPALLAAARNGDGGDNQTARAIADFESSPLDSLKGSSLKDSYQSMINGIASAAATAKTDADAAQSVQDTLEAQRQALSGVSLDEEAVNLMKQQRAFQGAAKLISTVDDLMKTLLAMT